MEHWPGQRLELLPAEREEALGLSLLRPPLLERGQALVTLDFREQVLRQLWSRD